MVQNMYDTLRQCGFRISSSYKSGNVRGKLCIKGLSMLQTKCLSNSLTASETVSNSGVRQFV